MPIRAGLTGALAASLIAGAAAAATADSRQASFDAGIAAAKSVMMAAPRTAYDKAQAALAVAQSEPNGPGRDLSTATAQWLSAEAMIRLKQPERALPLLDEALKVVTKASPDTKLQGDVLKSRGRAAAALGRVQNALADYQAAFRIYQKANEARSQAIALQEIGSIYGDARDYPHVLQYYAQSKEIFSQDPGLVLAAHNNGGFALKDMGRLAPAEAEFREALKAAVALKSAYLQAHILTNIAFTEAVAGKRAAARADALRGLALGAHDPEARGERPMLTGVLAKVAADGGDVAAAAKLLDQVFAGVDIEQTTNDYRDFHELAARVYERTGDRGKALAHLKAFKRLDDEGRALAASTNAALMGAQFDFANQNLRIVKLKAGQLQRDMMLAQSRARLNAVITGGLILGGGAAFAVTLFGFLSMRRSRNRIRAANERLGVSNTALEKALKAKTEFLATTSHEIRTPLNGILGMTQVILTDQTLSPGLRERVELMESSGVTMKALVDDLLDMAKMESGAITIQSGLFDLRKALRETIQFWSGQAALKGVALRLDLDGAPARFIGDESRLRQVLYNLMSNALKFTETGEVVLTARTGDNGLELSVTDSGIGIPADQHDHIFEAFAQADSGTSRQYGGAGLGLSICRSICAAMGGTVTVRSTTGEGSVFTVALPFAADQPMETGEAATGLASASLLLVDANPLSRSVMRAILEPVSARLDVAANLAMAAVQVSVSSPDVIVADGAALKGPDGTMAAGFQKLIAAAPAARLVVLLAAADAEQAALLNTVGARKVLVKPITGPALAAELSDCFENDVGAASIRAT
jgi:signal transduction histidine kinase